MNVSQALEHANAFVFPGFLVDDETLTAERQKNEEAIKVLLDEWQAAPAGKEPFSFDLIRGLADRNRSCCDSYGIERLHNVRAATLSREISVQTLAEGIATMQRRSVQDVLATAGPTGDNLDLAYVEKPVRGTVVGIDIETTDIDPARGYIINVGLEFMNLTAKAKPKHPFSGYCGIPDMYKEKGVPLDSVHHISWSDLEGQVPFRENKKMHEALLAAFKMYPFMAHNASFEDSWFMMHIDGYAEARKAGAIRIIDSRDICKRIDPDYRSADRMSRPAALENWARRRGTLAADESERHLGLEDVDLMFKTVQAEFIARNMFK